MIKRILGLGLSRLLSVTHGCERCAQNEKLHRQENKWFLIIQSDKKTKENKQCHLSS